MRSVAWQYKTLKLILLLNEIMSTVTLLRLSLLIVGKNRFLKENQVNVMQILQLKFRFNFKFIYNLIFFSNSFPFSNYTTRNAMLMI